MLNCYRYLHGNQFEDYAPFPTEDIYSSNEDIPSPTEDIRNVDMYLHFILNNYAI